MDNLKRRFKPEPFQDHRGVSLLVVGMLVLEIPKVLNELFFGMSAPIRRFCRTAGTSTVSDDDDQYGQYYLVYKYNVCAIPDRMQDCPQFEYS